MMMRRAQWFLINLPMVTSCVLKRKKYGENRACGESEWKWKRRKGEKSTTIAHRRLPVATTQSHGPEEARRRVFVIHGGQAQGKRNVRMAVANSGKAQIRTSGSGWDNGWLRRRRVSGVLGIQAALSSTQEACQSASDDSGTRPQLYRQVMRRGAGGARAAGVRSPV
jgi:hypothetical protein